MDLSRVEIFLLDLNILENLKGCHFLQKVHIKGIPVCQKLKQMCYTYFLVNTTDDCQGGPIMSFVLISLTCLACFC